MVKPTNLLKKAISQRKRTKSLEIMLLSFLSEQDTTMLSVLKWLCEELMEAEVTSKVQAKKSQRTDEHKGYRSRYRVRCFDTQMGTMYLSILKLRKGGYISFFVSERSRFEVALINVIQEAHVNGVSAGENNKPHKSLDIESISRRQASNITEELNEYVEAFKNRPLIKTYPVLRVDALYEKFATITKSSAMPSRRGRNYIW